MADQQRIADDTTDHGRFAVNAQWLMRLRWVASFGQLLTIGIAALALRIELQLLPLILLIGLTLATNVLFFIWLRRLTRRTALGHAQGNALLAAILGFDLLALTGLLYFSGGPENPFAIFYFVNLALPAVILPARWSWTLAGLAIGCLIFLFFRHRPVAGLSLEYMIRPYGTLKLYQLGQLVALMACPCIVIYFITLVTRELRQREEELRVAEQKRARSERLEALGTLAAGAGHELATPLSTIAVIAKELTRHLDGIEVPESVREDVAQIRKEVEICRSILNRLRGGVGQAAGESVSRISATNLVRTVLDGLHNPDRVEADLSSDLDETRLMIPLQNVAQAIRGVVQNAIDANAEDNLVQLRVSKRNDQLELVVIDQGKGMPSEVLQRVGEPFYTTKEPGKGMGLGVFLTRSVLERVGGELQLQSEPGKGTTATIRIPVA